MSYSKFITSYICMSMVELEHISFWVAQVLDYLPCNLFEMLVEILYKLSWWSDWQLQVIVLFLVLNLKQQTWYSSVANVNCEEETRVCIFYSMYGHVTLYLMHFTMWDWLAFIVCTCESYYYKYHWNMVLLWKLSWNKYYLGKKVITACRWDQQW